MLPLGARAAAAIRRRQATATPATIGAGIATRISFTTTAPFTATVPPELDAATTCPTSCTEAPTQCPNTAGSCSPSGPRSSGSTRIASEPHSVTSATASTGSGSSSDSPGRRVTPSIAATALAPQIAKPVAISSGCRPGRPMRCPSHCVPKNVVKS